MSCYLRHLDEVLNLAGIDVNKENRRKVDEAVHRVAGVKYKSCESAWKQIKKMMAEDKELLADRIRQEFAKA
ncbi:MAG TPA: hypothetical protein VMB46_08270 [Methanomassiliicoccales archaeon]|nr:hypothetical protein [Methanomassiliicoccales archaeon]